MDGCLESKMGTNYPEIWTYVDYDNHINMLSWSKNLDIQESD